MGTRKTERVLIRDHSDKEMERKTYRTSITETEDKIVEHFVTEGKYLTTYESKFDGCGWKAGDTWRSRSTCTQQKFLCVNGPLAGKKVTEKEAEKQRYTTYNCAGNSYYIEKEFKIKPPRVVLVQL